MTLPTVFDGDAPAWPLELLTGTESALWDELWLKPQAAMWSKLGLKFQVAAYVRAYLESVEPGAVNGLKTGVLRMEAELGLSIPGMTRLGWKFAEDEVAEVRQEKQRAVSARDRLRAING
ncbi:hypothetical protein [Agromyces sp. CF514]|uniref:hypothetical protein n=1 Tax=Agromyces sp. CF514 TaxID=1881031 RepID=UPI000B8169B6|nr:hypothetical protein [Agromyces sp. CF514]